jgi:hypothetical protein
MHEPIAFWQLSNEQKGDIYDSQEFRHQKAPAADFWDNVSTAYRQWILSNRGSEICMCGGKHCPTTCCNRA